MFRCRGSISQHHIRGITVTSFIVPTAGRLWSNCRKILTTGEVYRTLVLQTALFLICWRNGLDGRISEPKKSSFDFSDLFD